MPKLSDSGTGPSIRDSGGSSEDPQPRIQQSEVVDGSRRSSRHGSNGSSDLFLALRLQQEEYWAMHKKKTHSKKPSSQSASSSQPLKHGSDSAASAESLVAAQSQSSPRKRGHDGATSAAAVGAAQSQSSPRSSATDAKKKAHISDLVGQRSSITRPLNDAFGDHHFAIDSLAHFNHNEEMDRVALLLLALQECSEDIPSPQIVKKLEDSAILICTSVDHTGGELSFRLSPFDCQCPLANEVSSHAFKAPITSSISDLCTVVKEKLCPCAAEGDVQFFVRGLLLSNFATLRDAHSLWNVVFNGLPMTLHFRCMCACAGKLHDYVQGT